MPKTMYRSRSNQARAVTSSRMFPSTAFTFAAAAGGAFFGFVLAFAVALPMLHQALSADVAGVSAKLASAITSSDEACAQVSPSGEVLGASAVAPAVSSASQPTPGGQGGGQNQGNVFIKKLIGGQLTKNTASITNTGPYSSNEISTKNIATTTITNTNDIHVATSNEQQAMSGSTNVSGNTNGGSATSGGASNINSASLAVSVTN